MGVVLIAHKALWIFAWSFGDHWFLSFGKAADDAPTNHAFRTRTMEIINYVWYYSKRSYNPSLLSKKTSVVWFSPIQKTCWPTAPVAVVPATRTKDTLSLTLSTTLVAEDSCYLSTILLYFQLTPWSSLLLSLPCFPQLRPLLLLLVLLAPLLTWTLPGMSVVEQTKNNNTTWGNLLWICRPRWLWTDSVSNSTRVIFSSVIFSLLLIVYLFLFSVKCPWSSKCLTEPTNWST